MSVLGHRTMAEAERYTRNASQTMLRRPRLEARNGNIPTQTGSSGLGKRQKGKEMQRDRKFHGAPKGTRTPVFAVKEG